MQLKWLITEKYAHADKIVLVMDNLNTHNISSFYKTFSPEEAFSLSQKLEIHFTPKHGSWFDIAIPSTASNPAPFCVNQPEGLTAKVVWERRGGVCPPESIMARKNYRNIYLPNTKKIPNNNR